MPVTSPRSRRTLIELRDQATGVIANARGAVGAGRLPDAVIGGVQKGGTTFLYQELIRHPDVRGALTKEVHFFDDNWSKGLEWYRGHFNRGHELAVEASPSYLFHPRAIKRLSGTLTSAKVIVVLRDPVRRAFSHYQHEVRLGFEDSPTFEIALEREDERVEPELDRMAEDPDHVSFAWRHFAYRRRGEYVAQVRNARRHLPDDRLLFLRSEALYADTPAVLRSVQSFLGLPTFEPEDVGVNDMAAPGGARVGAETARRLADHYRSHNLALAEELDWVVPW